MAIINPDIRFKKNQNFSSWNLLKVKNPKTKGTYLWFLDFWLSKISKMKKFYFCKKLFLGLLWPFKTFKTIITSFDNFFTLYQKINFFNFYLYFTFKTHFSDPQSAPQLRGNVVSSKFFFQRVQRPRLGGLPENRFELSTYPGELRPKWIFLLLKFSTFLKKNEKFLFRRRRLYRPQNWFQGL